jgi:hypothetical protein
MTTALYVPVCSVDDATGANTLFLTGVHILSTSQFQVFLQNIPGYVGAGHAGTIYCYVGLGHS